MTPAPRTAALICLVAVLPGVGCFGGAANPSSFPYLTLPGDKIETHAKPAGRGYFADFDPHAAKVEISPTRSSAALGTEQVFIATVTDPDGNARRKRRVEWIVEGPGVLVEVDEAGYTPGRGYLMDNKRGVSYTGYRTHSFDRGTESGADDFCVEPGQTWCVVRSSEPGETVVTAYAPAVYNSDRRKASARVTWEGGGRSALRRDPPPDSAGAPPALGKDDFTPIAKPAGRSQEKGRGGDSSGLTLELRADEVARPNEETTFAVELKNGSANASPEVEVSLNRPAGVEVVKVEPDPAPGGSPERITWAFGALPGNSTKVGKVRVRPLRNGPVKLDAEAKSADGVSASQRASVAVGRAELKLTLATLPEAEVGDTVRLGGVVANDSPVPAEGVAVFLALPKGLRHASGKDVVEVEPRLGKLAGDSQTRFGLDVKVIEPGEHRAAANLTAKGGLADKAETLVTARPPPPPRAAPAVPTLPAAELTALAPLPLPGPRPAPEFRKPPPAEPILLPALSVEWGSLPTDLAAGETRTVSVRVTNTGQGAARNVRLTAGGEGVRAERGTGADRAPAAANGSKLAFGALPTLGAGEVAVYGVELRGDKPGPARVTAAATAENQAAPAREEQALRVVAK